MKSHSNDDGLATVANDLVNKIVQTAILQVKSESHGRNEGEQGMCYRGTKKARIMSSKEVSVIDVTLAI